MNASTECVDRYIDHLIQNGQTNFQARDLAAYANTLVGWPWPTYSIDRSGASTMLQVHRQDHRKRHVLGCTGHGRYAEWYVAGSRDARRMLRRAVSEHAEAVVRDLTYRVDPAAAMDPNVAAAMNQTTMIVKGALDTLVRVVAHTGGASNGQP